MLLSLFVFLNYFTINLATDPSHFRIVPLNFYTPDNRNDQYFKDSNYYGVRLAWIASEPPSNDISINNDLGYNKLNWHTKGKFNVHKNQWGNNLWDYSFIDTSLYVGKNLITIDKWTYTINIPHFGIKTSNDDTTLFIGDVNIAKAGQFALGEADKVIKNIVLEYQNISPLIVWVGDIFYHDTSNIITEEWPKLINNNNNNINGITNYLHIGILGNHDYISHTACHDCNWHINRNGLSCANSNEPSGSWVQYFFATDALKSFHNDLSSVYHRGCRVPYEYSFQIIVLGRTGYITIDNTWAPNEVNINWNDVKNKLNNYIDTIFIIGHWDMIHAGSKSGVTDWILYLYKYFDNKQIHGIQGHTHINKYEHINRYSHRYQKNIDYKLITTGGNGFKGSGCNCKNNCFYCHCCCPTLYKNNTWVIGGWDNNNLCFGKH